MTRLFLSTLSLYLTKAISQLVSIVEVPLAGTLPCRRSALPFSRALVLVKKGKKTEMRRETVRLAHDWLEALLSFPKGDDLAGGAARDRRTSHSANGYSPDQVVP